MSILVRFLDLIKPFTPLLPEVAAPETKVPFNQKLMWTGVRCSLKYLWMRRIDLKSNSMFFLVDSPDLPGHESDAFVRYRLLRHLGPPVLAAHDAGQ